VHWVFVLPLLATLVSCVVLVRALQLLTAESRALTASAARLVPVASAVADASRQARGFGATLASAARRYTPRHG
jgi:hypothetical protein